MDKTLARIAVLHPDFGVWATSADGGRIPELVARFRPVCDKVLDCVGNHTYIDELEVLECMKVYSRQFPDLLFQLAVFWHTDERIQVYLLKNGVAVGLMDEGSEDRNVFGRCLRMVRYAADSYVMLNELTHYIVAEYSAALPLRVPLQVEDFWHYVNCSSSGAFMHEHAVAANDPGAFAEDEAFFAEFAGKFYANTLATRGLELCPTQLSQMVALAPRSRRLMLYCHGCGTHVAIADDDATDTCHEINSRVRTCGSARELHRLISKGRLQTFECLACKAASTTYLSGAKPTSGARAVSGVERTDQLPARVSRV